MSTHWLHHTGVLQTFRWEVLTNALLSPDLAPSNYHLFMKLKEHMAGKTSDDDYKVQRLVMMWLREQTGNFYYIGMKKLVSRSPNVLRGPQ